MASVGPPRRARRLRGAFEALRMGGERVEGPFKGVIGLGPFKGVIGLGPFKGLIGLGPFKGS